MAVLSGRLMLDLRDARVQAEAAVVPYGELVADPVQLGFEIAPQPPRRHWREATIWRWKCGDADVVLDQPRDQVVDERFDVDRSRFTVTSIALTTGLGVPGARPDGESDSIAAIHHRPIATGDRQPPDLAPVRASAHEVVVLLGRSGPQDTIVLAV
jgi:hypothetical protein